MVQLTNKLFILVNLILICDFCISRIKEGLVELHVDPLLNTFRCKIKQSISQEIYIGINQFLHRIKTLQN